MWNTRTFCALYLNLSLHWESWTKHRFPSKSFQVSAFGKKKRDLAFYSEFGLIYGVTIYLCGGMFHLPLLFPSNKFCTWKTHTNNANKNRTLNCCLECNCEALLFDGNRIMLRAEKNATFCKQKLNPATINNIFSNEAHKKYEPTSHESGSFHWNFWHWKLIRYETINGFRWSSIWQCTAY